MSMDIWETRPVAPMLIGREGEAFDHPDYIYELKLDGERCVAYLDPKKGTELYNKRANKLISKVPELQNIHKQVRKPCILDGELIVAVDGKPDFSKIQRRSLMTNTLRIEMAAAQYPASFVAYDILYLDGEEVMGLPLLERKKLLQKTVKETERISISRYIPEQGTALYKLTEEQGLEGIVAKPKGSKYFPGIRSKDWIKIKNLLDDDFVICGYIRKSAHMTSLVLGQYNTKGELLYRGHVTLGISRKDFSIIENTPQLQKPSFSSYPKDKSGNDRAVWIQPELVCTVKFMERTANGGMRQPVYKGLRMDKSPEDCLIYSLNFEK